MRLGFLVALLLLTSGCASEIDLGKRYGLPWADLRVNEEREAQIYHGGKRKLEVPARLHWNGRTIRGRASLSGSASLDSLKKSYIFSSSEELDVGAWSSYKISAQTQDDSFIRTLLGFEIFSSLGLETPRVQAIVFSINGRYQGLYLLIEPIDEGFFLRRGLSPARIYRNNSIHADFGSHLIVDPGFGFKSKYGQFHGAEISQVARWARREPYPEGLRELNGFMDVENVVRYFAGTIFLENCDGLANNIFIYKLRDNQRWHFSPWDWERSFDHDCGLTQLLQMNRLFERILDYGLGKQRVAEALDELARKFPRERVVEFVDWHARRMKKAYQEDPYLGGQGRRIEEYKNRLIERLGVWMTHLE